MLNEIEQKIDELSRQVARTEGELDLLKRQQEASIVLIEGHKQLVVDHKKAIELLNLVQQVTREKVKGGFEQLVSHALQFIYNNKYRFQLEFGKRGNLQELNFNIKTPSFEEYADPLDTEGGGVIDIISLALRCVLLELAEAKGFILLDESLKHLSVEYRQNALQFLKEISEKLNRQVIMITHQSEFIDGADHLIEIT